MNQNMMNQMQNPSFQALSRPGGRWSGYDAAMMTTSPYSQNQRNQMNQVGQMGMQGLQTGQMPGGFDFNPIAQQAQTQFNTQTIPSLAERFTSLGGGQRSSAFQGALGQAGAGLQENLASMKSQYQAQMMPMLLEMLGMGMKPQEEQTFLPREAGLWENLGGQAIHGLASALPGLATGNPLGGLMDMFKGMFSGAPQAQGFPQQQTRSPYQFGGGVAAGLPSSFMQNRGAFNFM